VLEDDWESPDMAEAQSIETLEAMFLRLPREEETPDPENVTRRIRIVTHEGRTLFAFLRAGRGSLSFAGWDATSDVEDLVWAYFVIAAQKPGAPLYVIGEQGPVGTVRSAELEEKPE